MAVLAHRLTWLWELVLQQTPDYASLGHEKLLTLGLASAVVLLFLFYRHRQSNAAAAVDRRAAVDRMSVSGAGAAAAAGAAGGAASTPSDQELVHDHGASGDWWYSPLASPAEAQVISKALQLVDSSLLPLPPHADISMLRQLRGPAMGCDAPRLAHLYSKALRWRRENVEELPGRREAIWPAAIELAHGQWASEFSQMGFGIGRARGGHPVKLERIGHCDVVRILAIPGGYERMRGYYYSLLDTMLTSLDAESAACGQLLRMYEVFDMQGMSMRQVSWKVLGFARALINVVLGVYAEVTCKAVLLNLPRSVVLPVRRARSAA